MEASASPTDPDLIRRVIARMRLYNYGMLDGYAEPSAPPVFVCRTGGWMQDLEITDLRLVIPWELPQHALYALPNSELNAPEVMAWFFEWYGVEAFFKAEGAVIVQMDDFGTLWEIGAWDEDDNADYTGIMRAVEVVDATPQPDGSFKHYFLTVPPEIRTAQQAVAWTFGFDRVEDYLPIIQS
jgi:hypothetical protein